MTALQRTQIAALRRCTFAVGSAPKRFVRQAAAWTDDKAISPKGAAYLNRLAHAYRKQIGRCLAAPCERCDVPAPSDTTEIGAQPGLFGGRS